MRLTSSLALTGLLAAGLVPAAAQTTAPAQSGSAPIVTTAPGASNGTSTTGVNTNGTGTAAGTAAPATITPNPTMSGGAGNGPGTTTGTSPGTGTTATGTTGNGTVITPSMSGKTLENAGAPPNATNATDANAAVDTTGAKAVAQPAKGANSFTEGQAKSRLADNGFTDISPLTKDADGVWRGRATKAGKTGDVWLDYRGNYGQP